MSIKRAFRRLAAPVAAVIVGATAVVSIGAAHAAVIGGLSIDPSPTGLDTSAITVTTAAACPGGTNLQGTLAGAGFASPVNVTSNAPQSTFPTTTAGGYIIPLGNTLQFYGNAQTPPVVFSGKYDITITCRNAFGATSFGDFVGSIWFTSPHAYQTTDPNAQPTATSTTVSATPASPQVAGTNVILNALVAPNAAGTVKFMDGATQVGATQTVTSASGAASVSTTTLAVGGHSFTAVFTPTNPTAFGPSTSGAIGYTINPATGVTPTSTVLTASPPSPHKIGTSVTLQATVSPAADGTVTFMDGAAQIGTTQTVTGASGSASIITAALGIGMHSLTAVFVPTDPAAFGGSTSAPLLYKVTMAARPVRTHTALGATHTIVGPGDVDISLSVEVTAGDAHPDGRVVLFDGHRRLGSRILVDGLATFAIDGASTGVHRFRARFDAHNSRQYRDSTSRIVRVVVPEAPEAVQTSNAVDTDGSTTRAVSYQRGWTVTTADFRSPMQSVSDGALLGTPVRSATALSGTTLAVLGGTALVAMGAFVTHRRRPRRRHLAPSRVVRGIHRKD